MSSKKNILSYLLFGRYTLYMLLNISVVRGEDVLNSGSFVNGYMLVKDLVTTQKKSLLPSYKYITVLYTGVQSGTKEYDVLQQAIYLDIIPNKSKILNLSRPLTAKSAKRLIKNLLNKQITINATGFLHYSDISMLVDELAVAQSKNNSTISIGEDSETLFILQDAYKKIRENYLNVADIDDKKLIQGAVKGMTQATKDPYTVYFPPDDAQEFNESMQGEFFGIGAYIEMSEPGKLIIVSPIEGTPANLAGLLPGDQIIKINDEVVTDMMNVNMAVSKIKGPEDTVVKITILRDKQEFIKEIVRKKVVIKPLMLKELSADKALISISMFQFGLDNLFEQTVSDIIKKGYTTLVFDLRNNPGGSLDDVEHMLDYIVPKGDISVIVKTNTSEVPYVSDGVESGKELTNKKIIILINKGSASASEIMAGVIKEYASDVTIIGEKSFGKGSVQSIRDYSDGSAIKITVAKWLMGKTRTSIDQSGITPDKEIIDDPKTSVDEVLEYVKNL